MAYKLSPEESKERLMHVLEIFPAISPSMMNIAMNSVDSACWKPTLQEMLVAGEIKSKTIFVLTPIGRNQSYTVYFHPKFDYNEYYEKNFRQTFGGVSTFDDTAGGDDEEHQNQDEDESEPVAQAD